ncbi:hypothetical protein SAMN02744133_11331 [Thalassospira xiamenensis M-5 = DSM 17429]|nr:hypothetical protein SAMN02744133_11331 [Thalassospira xiamenensis M-5 = DSM 17429]
MSHDGRGPPCWQGGGEIVIGSVWPRLAELGSRWQTAAGGGSVGANGPVRLVRRAGVRRLFGFPCSSNGGHPPKEPARQSLAEPRVGGSMGGSRQVAFHRVAGSGRTTKGARSSSARNLWRGAKRTVRRPEARPRPGTGSDGAYLLAGLRITRLPCRLGILAEFFWEPPVVTAYLENGAKAIMMGQG